MPENNKKQNAIKRKEKREVKYTKDARKCNKEETPDNSVEQNTAEKMSDNKEETKIPE